MHGLDESLGTLDLSLSGAVGDGSVLNFGAGSSLFSLENASFSGSVTMSMGAGDDTVGFAGVTGAASLAGGEGTDVLGLDGMGANITFSYIFGTGRIAATSFECIDLAGDSANTLTLSLADILALDGDAIESAVTFSDLSGNNSSIASGSSLTRLTGDAEDSVLLAGSDWGSSLGTFVENGINYNVFKGTGSENQYLLVQNSVRVTSS